MFRFVVDYENREVYLFDIHTPLVFSRDNFLVLDIFFEALNYETIEQKKAYDVAGLLGNISSRRWICKHTEWNVLVYLPGAVLASCP